MTDKARNVHIRDHKGYVRYNMLVDTGAEVLWFSTSGGFLTRLQINRNGWEICEGHLSRHQMDAIRANYHART